MKNEAAPLLSQVSGERRRDGIAERGVGTPGVIIDSPCGNFLAGMGKAGKERLIE
jgi:hypothetical protein